MKLKKTTFDNLKEFLDYLYSFLYIDYISMSFEFSSIKIRESLMDFHVYVLPKGFTFKSAEEVNTVMSRCTSLDTYTQVIMGNNIKINPNVILTPPKRCKGLVVYDRGTLSNLGSISMYARGCIAQGQDIYLTHLEYVPAVGGAGGGRLNGYEATYNGNNGVNGTNRKSGGGGSGSYRNYSGRSNNHNGAGSAGTSYSGGSGGGAGIINYGSNTSNGAGAQNASSNGGKGGNSFTYEWYFDGVFAGGGQGNPSGSMSCAGGYISYTAPEGQDEGTGGLLIIYCSNLYNVGNINANGVIAKYANTTYTRNERGRCNGSGGSSGGGSINIFCDNMYDGINTGTIVSNGGARQTRNMNVSGGAGGNGCVTIDVVKTYSEDNYNESIYNDNEYVEIPEIITEEQDNFNSKYIVHDFLYNGHNHQSFTFEPNTEYTIECWGARGGSDDGDDYPNIVKGSYGNYICAKYVTSVSTIADIIIGESGSPGGGGWPDGASSASEWGVNDPKRFCNRPTAGGSTALNINDIKTITAKGGNSGTAEIIGTSSNHRITLDMSLVNDSVKNTLTCNCEINGHSGKFYNVLQKEWKSILIFCSQPSSSTGKHDRITFTWNALTNSSFMEFRIVRPTNQTNRLPELYDAYIYGAGPSGSIWMDCATSTMYAIQIKTSMFASFECSLLDSWNVEYNYPLFYFGSSLTSNDIVENHLVPSYRTWNDGMVVSGPVNSTSADYISSNVERISISKMIPDIAGYHGMVRVSELSKEYIYTSDNDDTIEFTGKQEKLILIPDKLGNRYVNTKFLLECHGASAQDGTKGSCIKSIIAIDNPLMLFCKIGEKSNGQSIQYNNVYKYFNFDTGTYNVNLLCGGNTTISTANEYSDTKNILVNCNGGSLNSSFVSILNEQLTGPGFTITYDYISSTGTSGSVYYESQPSNTMLDAPRVLIIIPKQDGQINFRTNGVIKGTPYGRISGDNDNANIIADAYLAGQTFNISLNVIKGNTYKLICTSYYMDPPVEYKFIATYPESNVYAITGTRTNGVNGTVTQVHNNVILKPRTDNYIKEKYYSPFLGTNSTFLKIVNKYHDNRQYYTFTRIEAGYVVIQVRNATNSGDNGGKNLVCVIKRTGNACTYSSTNISGKPWRYVKSSYSSTPSYPGGVSPLMADNFATYHYQNRYDAIYCGSDSSSPASYDVTIRNNFEGNIYIPVNGQMVPVYSLEKTELSNSDIVQKNMEFNNYVNPILTDVSISESNRTGNGIIYIKKLPMENDDYILNPDAIKVTEMTDEHNIYPSK